MKILTALAVAAGLAIAAPAYATVDHIMPKAKQLALTDCPGFDTNRPVKLTDPTQCAELLRFMTDAGLSTDPNAQATITVTLGPVSGAYDYQLEGYPDEAYAISVQANAITITAPTPTGVIRAAQTLRIMAMDCDGAIQAANIADWPAFKLRGFMQDVGRSFLPVDELKREIDMLSRFKVNTFHWHLTDNTGWRLAINAYPQLTGSKSITRYPGCFYTQDDAKEIQDYAAERGMTVIPEIDMPGHSGPFERAMGHSMQTAQGIAELKVILREVVDLFDKAPYIHIGGDEVGFDDSYIVDMINYVHSLGRKAVIWNQYNRPAKLINPANIPADMCTNWATSGRLVKGIPNIDMRYNYTNHFDVFADPVGIFKSTIFEATQGNPDIAGTISAAWNDTKTPTFDDIVRQNNIYTNILASAERAWTGGGKQYIETGGTTLPASGSEYDEFADWERRYLYHKATTLAPTAHLIPYVRQTNVRWYVTEQIPNGGNPDTVLPPENYIDTDDTPSTFDVAGNTYGVIPVTGAGIYLRHIWHGTVKGIYPNPQNGMTAYAWTYIWSPEEQDAAALIEFYTYSRSGNEVAPPAGKWDRRGSRIWLNGAELPAPKWQQPGAAIKQDQTDSGLTNENLTARPPVPVHLIKGWNKVFMKLPHANNGGTGRDKWQFTFVLTDTDGTNALDGIIYSPMRMTDTAAEQLLSLITEIRSWCDTYVKDLPGYYPPSAAANCLALCDTYQATLDDPDITPDTRNAHIAALTQAFEATKADAAAGTIALPVDQGTYALSTPLRNGHYVTGQGAGMPPVGNVTLTQAANWTFKLRPDGSYDIVNAKDGTYINPSAANNTALSAVANPPAKGWNILASNETGYAIIVSGSIQWNQTNAAQQYKLYNWGYDTPQAPGQYRLDDTGCKFRFTPINIPNSIDPVTADTHPRGTYNLAGQRIPDNTNLTPGLYIRDGRKTIVR